MEKAYKGQQLSRPIVVAGLLNGQSVTTMQQPFLLTEADFVRLKGNISFGTGASAMMLSCVVGYIYSLGPKLLQFFGGNYNTINSGEISTVVIGMVISIGMYGIGHCCPSDKTKTMKKISDHFDSAPPSSHIVGGRQ